MLSQTDHINPINIGKFNQMPFLTVFSIQFRLYSSILENQSFDEVKVEVI